MTDFTDMLRQLASQLPALGQQVQAAKEKIEQITAEGSSGGGMVTAKVNGRHRLLALTIDPSLGASEDLGMVEDLVIAAVNQAQERVHEALQQEAASVASGASGLDLESLFGTGGPPGESEKG